LFSKIKAMTVQLVSDINGKVTAVQIPVKEWKKLEEKLELFDIAESIKVGHKEMQQIEDGELKAKSFEEFLNEL